MRTTTMKRFHAGFATLAAAIRAASAVEAHRIPAARDLRTLEIDPETFRNIRL